VKFLFTEERLSVQVHPGGPDGKTEMWHILRAGPRAEVALGFIRELTAAELREASVSGEVERLLRWFPVTAGDTIFVPAGTVHAIGADLALCEIQQYSDVTYRLYDYGRPRELHLDAALPISHLGAHPSPVRPAGEHLVSCEYFETSRLSLTSDRTIQGGMAVILDGAGTIDDQPCARGQAWQIPGQSCLSGQLEVLVTRVP
jgi:mannose-6-phosphate isomerase